MPAPMDVHYVEVGLAACPVGAFQDLEEDDRHVPGVYSLLLPVSLTADQFASAALDTFHSCVPVSTLDDFNFYVFDPKSQRLMTEREDHEPYSLRVGVDLVKLSDDQLALFEVGENNEIAIVACSRAKALELASGCQPVSPSERPPAG